MAATKWTGLGHDLSWFDAGNWTSGIPVSQQATVFSDGGNWTIDLAGPNHATAGKTTVLGDTLTFTHGTLDLTAAQPAQGYPVDMTIGRNGSVSVAAGATLTSHYIIEVGAVVAGALTPGSMTVHGTVQGAFFDVLDGSAAVSGPAAHLALLYDGFSAEVAGGSLTVSAGGTLDAGPDSLANNFSAMNIGASGYDGVVAVTGAHSVLSLSGLIFGNDASGTLDIGHGGTVHINYLATEGYGGANVSVNGAGSTLIAERGISIGDDGSLSGLTLSITQGAAVSSGTYGLALRYGALQLDATAHLSGSIYSQVGQLDAVATSSFAPGTVTLAQSILLDSNQGAQGQYAYATDVYSQGGAVLRLDGQITSLNSATLEAGGGTVVLGNASNSYSATSIYDAHLEIATTGAAGSGQMSFVAGAAQTPVLQIDAGVAFGNVISGFAGHDAIDLRGFAFGQDITDTFAAGTLTLSNGQGTTALSLTGPYTAGSFAFASDHQGGTVITFVQHG